MKITNDARLLLVESNMMELKNEISEVRTDIKALSKQVEAVLNAKLVDHIEMKSEIRIIESAIEKIERSSDLWKWLSPSLSALLSALLTYLLISYIQHLK